MATSEEINKVYDDLRCIELEALRTKKKGDLAVRGCL